MRTVIQYGRWKPEDRTPLALLRYNAGYSRDQAAVLMEISSSTLANYERGLKDVPFGMGEKMSVLYNCSFEDIRQAVSVTKENKVLRKHRPPKDREVWDEALKNADNLKGSEING